MRFIFSVLFPLILVTTANAVCPEPHTRLLARFDSSAGDQKLAEINMLTNRVNILGAHSELLSISQVLKEGPLQGVFPICGAGGRVDVCDYDQGLLGLNLISRPFTILEIKIRAHDLNRDITFESTDFYIPRSECGLTDYPVENQI